MDEIKEQLDRLKSRIEALANKIDLNKKKQEIALLEAKTYQSNFWTDVLEAQKVMQTLDSHKKLVYDLNDILARAQNAQDLLQLAQSSEKETDILEPLTEELKEIEKIVDRLELQLFL